jgi:hypothetical protein
MMDKKTYKNIIKILLFCSCLFLSGCFVKGVVSSATYKLPSEYSTYSIKTDTIQTLTEQRIQGYIIDKMSSYGFKKIDDVNKAEYALVYSYKIGGGKTVVSSTYIYVLDSKKMTSSTEYPRYFQIGLIDQKASKEANKIIFAWQGEVYSKGVSSNIINVAKYFIEQIFSEYGQNTYDKNIVVPRM